MGCTTKVLIKRPTVYGRKPRTAAELLRQTRQFLDEEGKWIKGQMFKDGSAKDAYENGFCGKWGVCSVGAIGLVSGEFAPGVYADHYGQYYWTEEYEPETFVANEACAYLALAIDPRYVRDLIESDITVESYGWQYAERVIEWNAANSRTRKQVLATFAKAAELAARRGNFGSVAIKHLQSIGLEVEF
jgi:hypothetical protein